MKRQSAMLIPYANYTRYKKDKSVIIHKHYATYKGIQGTWKNMPLCSALDGSQWSIPYYWVGVCMI